jgi:hypothetical protein
MAKTATFPLIIDRCLTVSIADLKRWGCLKPGYRLTGIAYWMQGSERVASVGYNSFLAPDADGSFITFDYRHDGQPVKLHLPLISAPANIGKGRVWFFRCPATGQRCKKLHLINGRFMHRSAVREAMYKQQTQSKKWRQISRFFDMYEIQEAVLAELTKPGFKEKYRGRETRRLTQLIRKVEKAGKGVNVRDVFLSL